VLAMLAMLAEVTDRLAEAGAFDALVVTGGETARTVLLACAARGLELAGELEPGIPSASLTARGGCPWSSRQAVSETTACSPGCETR
jgi:uncharacterized protein YgbK (DUF1537 family)